MASADQNRKITGNIAGIVLISAKTRDGNKSASCYVTEVRNRAKGEARKEFKEWLP